MANEEEAAIGFSGRISLNGLLPSPGPATRIVEGDDRCGAARGAGVTLRGAGFFGAPLIGPKALGEGAGLGLARGGAFRAISPVEPLRSGLAWGLAGGLDAIVGDEFGSVEGTFAKDSESRVLFLDFFSGGQASSSLLAREELSESMRDSSVSGAGGFTAGVLKGFAAGGVEVREVVSPGRLGSAGDVASIASIEFWASRRRFPSGARPTVSPTARLITANKNIIEAT